MEAFSLLKYWRGGGGVLTRETHSNPRPTDSSSSTIVTAVSPSSSDSDSDDGDDGPFFDLEFALPEDDSDSDSEEDQTKEPPNLEELKNENENEEEVADDEEEEIKFTLSSSSSGDAADSTDPNVTLSPSDDLFFKGHLLPIDSSSMILNASEVLPKFPVSSILKSATKLRVQMMKFNKPKSNLPEKSAKSEPKSHQKFENEKNESQERKQQSKFFTVKLKVEEVPLVSLFTRDTSSKGTNSKSIRQQDVNTEEDSTDSSCNGDEKKFSKEYAMQKYFKKVKPLYIRVSKRYGDKLRFSGHLSIPKSVPAPAQPPPSTAEVKAPTEISTAVKAGGGAEGAEVAEVAAVGNVKSQKQGNLQAGLRVVCKHLGKSRSASSSAPAPAVPVVSKRRDDSLLQQQDGIQSAILHCKRSFNASRDMEASILSRSVSDPSHEKSVN